MIDGSFFKEKYFSVFFISALTFLVLIRSFYIRIRSFYKKRHLQAKRNPNPNPNPQPNTQTLITSSDIKAIAGEDLLATQLDLARAYIELDKKTIAKQILLHVMKNGAASLQKEASQLMATL